MIRKEKISSLKALKDRLELKPAYLTYGEVLAHIDFHSSIVQQYSSWNSEHFTKNLLFSNGEFELVMACFNPGQMTNIHNYGHQQGWGIILEGKLTEIKYATHGKLGEPSILFEKEFAKGEVTYINDYHGMHQFENRSDKRAISLHLLIEKVDHWKAYDPKNKTFFDEVVKFDSDFSHNMV